MIHHGDCLEVMAGMEPESIDAIVTDPPYLLPLLRDPPRRYMRMVRCEHCGTEFVPAKPIRRFCSKSCSNLARWDSGVYSRGDGLTYYERHRDDILASRRRTYDKDKVIARIKARRAEPLERPCEQCSSTRNVVRHHPDYDQPTVVQFLCRRCHAFVHGRAGVRRVA